MQGHPMQFQRPVLLDAITYLGQVQRQFETQVYNALLDILREITSESIDIPSGIQRVTNLFHGHPDIIHGFNIYIPTHRIQVQPNGQVLVSIPGSSPGSPEKSLIFHPGGPPLVTSTPPQVNPSPPTAASAPAIIQTATTTTISQDILICSQSQLSGGLAWSIQAQAHGNLQMVHAAQMQGHQMQFKRLNSKEEEEARSYLHQVRYVFENQPQVWNDFIDIMKGFKTQRVDIIGLIQRVSNMFCDHPELIVGFNTFLPPGYLIQVQPNRQVLVSKSGSSPGSPEKSLIIHPGRPPLVSSKPQQVYHPSPAASSAPDLARVAAATTRSQFSFGYSQSPGSGDHHALSVQAQVHSNSQTVHPIQSNSQHMQAHAAQMQGYQIQFQSLNVEDPLSYLDQVKYKFGNQPQVYNNFLEIMKDFKNQSIDIPGVIQHVSNLFRGHPELIIGFNVFLPPGYRIEVQPNEQVQVSIPGSSPRSTGRSLTIRPLEPSLVLSQQLHHCFPAASSAPAVVAPADEKDVIFPRI